MKQTTLDKFSKETADELKSYVYRLIDPRNGNTFYVGKGQGNRVFDHAKGLKASGDEDKDKFKVIQAIHNAGLEVIHVIHRHGMTEDTALEVEAALIDAYPGLTNIQGGHDSAQRGPANTVELKEAYGAPRIKSFPDTDKCLIIKVRQETVDERGSVYEAMRSSWIIGAKREQTQYALGVVNGVVREVRMNMKWTQVPDSRRFEFTADPADQDAQDRYLGRRIPDKYRQPGQANPVLFTW